MSDDARLRSALEATALGYGVDREAVARLCRVATDEGLAGVCVPPVHVPAARRALDEGRGPALVTVAGFPFAHRPAGAIAAEVAQAVALGAEVVDVVLPLSLARAGPPAAITGYAERMVAAAGAGRVKLILETGALEEAQMVRAARASAEAGVGWVKTSTGFHPAGGASAGDVATLRASVPAGVGVKASGGIRTRERALAMLGAGADRIGASSVEALLTPPAGPGR